MKSEKQIAVAISRTGLPRMTFEEFLEWADERGFIRSAVLDGLTLDVKWLWQDPKPTLKSLLAAWGLD